MARVTFIVTALVVALVGAFSSTTMAQTDTRDRTFLTFSGAGGDAGRDAAGGHLRVQARGHVVAQRRAGVGP